MTMKVDKSSRDSWRTKRQRLAWDWGFRAGRDHMTEEAESVSTCRWRVQNLESQLEYAKLRIAKADGRVADLQRELQFAKDRIEQLSHTTVIIRQDKK